MFEWFRDAFGSLISWVKSWVEDRLRPIRNAIQNLFARAKEYAYGLVRDLKKSWEIYIKFVAWLMRVIGHQVKEFIRDPAGYIKRVMQGTITALRKWVSDLVKGVSDWAHEHFGWLWGQVQKISGNIWKQIQDIVEYIRDLPSKVWQWVYPKVTDWFNTMLENFIRFTMQAMGELQSFLYDHLMEYMRYTFYEQMLQIYKQNNLPLPDREAYLKSLEKNKNITKRMLGGG